MAARNRLPPWHEQLRLANGRDLRSTGPGNRHRRSPLREVMAEGGFTRFRRATETAFTLVLEARP